MMDSTVSPFLRRLVRLVDYYDRPGSELDSAVLARALGILLPHAHKLPHDDYLALCDLSAGVTAPAYDTDTGAA